MKRKKQKTYSIAYVCNGSNPNCMNREGCFYAPTTKPGPCSHTLNATYAKFKPLHNPKANPEWFDKVTDKSGEKYFERLAPKS